MPEPATSAEMAEAGPGRTAALQAVVPAKAPFDVVTMFPLFLAFWFLCAFVTFSWAGEKMPWLNTHIALPGNLLVAWGISRIVGSLGQSKGERPSSGVWLIPFALTLALVAVSVALWRFGSSSADQQGQADLLQGLVPLAVAGVLLYAILTLGQRLGARLTLGVCALTLAALTGTYTLRATWMVVYAHPDTPRDPLVYVQSSPDVPLIVDEIRELAIAQTRNARNLDAGDHGQRRPERGRRGEPGVALPVVPARLQAARGARRRLLP
jgi:predicted membrane-bound mannosyltransferase